MEPVSSLKRESEVDYTMCIICQEKRKDELRTSSTLETIKKCNNDRKKLHDSKYRATIDRLDEVFQSANRTSLVWHRLCYATFTDVGKINKLRIQVAEHSKPSCSSTSQPIQSRRSSMERVDWDQCIFCQKTKRRSVRLINVESFSMNKSIMEDAKLDQTMSFRLAGVNDLIASEGKYHLGCLSDFRRKVVKVKNDTKGCDIAMMWLCSELCEAANKGHVFEMSDVWKRYCTLAEESATQIPASYLSRSATFREKLHSKIHHLYVIVPSSRHGHGEHHILLIPVKYKFANVLNVTNENDGTDDDEVLTIPKFNHDDIFLSMVHVFICLLYQDVAVYLYIM